VPLMHAGGRRGEGEEAESEASVEDGAMVDVTARLLPYGMHVEYGDILRGVSLDCEAEGVLEIVNIPSNVFHIGPTTPAFLHVPT
jgi:hypothetical protein